MCVRAYVHVCVQNNEFNPHCKHVPLCREDNNPLLIFLDCFFRAGQEIDGETSMLGNSVVKIGECTLQVSRRERTSGSSFYTNTHTHACIAFTYICMHACICM